MEDTHEYGRVLFGLEAQGHIEYIEEKISEWPTGINSHGLWDIIGKHIGWDPFTAYLYYQKYLNKENENFEDDLQEIEEPVGAFIILQHDLGIQLNSGRFYSYSEVCQILNRFKKSLNQ